MLGIVRAPELDSPLLRWMNTRSALRLADMRGRMVILDFCTFCCVNCIHALPTLARLEKQFEGRVTVISVHSPKHAAEKVPENVACAIDRYNVTHPVVHDPEMVLWDAYCIRAWPTLVIIDPRGRIVGTMSGEPQTETFVSGIKNMLDMWEAEGAIHPGVCPDLDPPPHHGGPLAFPAKVRPCPPGDDNVAFALADSGHNQIVLIDANGTEIRRIGSGNASLVDGPAEAAAFNRPQGVCATVGGLFVADTANHAIRRIDRTTGAVTTVCGTGERGFGLDEPEDIAKAELASPWDIAVHGRDLYFCNSGSHQIGRLSLGTGTVEAVAGCGGEDLVDGPALDALLAQPSALAFSDCGKRLFFTDSESSSVRMLDLVSNRVETLVGSGLFVFGHANGPFSQAELQHPLDIAVDGERLIVADSYNGRLRVLDLKTRTVTDLGERAFSQPEGRCRPTGEPSGLCVAGPGRYLVADTNNHRLIAIDTNTQTTTPLMCDSLSAC